MVVLEWGEDKCYWLIQILLLFFFLFYFFTYFVLFFFFFVNDLGTDIIPTFYKNRNQEICYQFLLPTILVPPHICTKLNIFGIERSIFDTGTKFLRNLGSGSSLPVLVACLPMIWVVSQICIELSIFSTDTKFLRNSGFGKFRIGIGIVLYRY